MTEPHVDHDALVVLALQQAEPEQRARLSEHLAECPRCRAEYAELEDAVQRTIAAAPSVAPTAGFSGRVLAQMGLRETGPNSASGLGRARGRWQWLAVAAAALLVGLGLGIGGTLAVTTSPAPAGSAPAAATRASALVDRSGEPVGTAGLAVLSGRDHLLITVTRARPGAVYECVVMRTDGHRHSAGTWRLDAGYGATQASGSWVVQVPPGEVARVELMAPSGAVWARADF